VSYRRFIYGTIVAVVGLSALALAQTSPPQTAPATGGRTGPGAGGDIEKVERVLAARREYQASLEQLRTQYMATGDTERAKWAEEELLQYHRIAKQAYRLELDVPPPTLQAPPITVKNVPEANELYMRAVGYKDKGWTGTDYIDNQRRAELLFQQLINLYPESNKLSSAAYQLADLYEGKAYRQYRRAASYFERCFQWNPHTEFDARIRAARLYDKNLQERSRAIEIYKEITTHETDPKRMAEAKKRLDELRVKKY
jgi:tetratricopeptide (TPR) repeat protein